MSRITVDLPQTFNLKSTHKFVGRVIDTIGLPRATEIVFDFSQLRFIDGSGLTVFCNTLEWLFNRDVKCSFRHFNLNNEAVRYLDDCGFFKKYIGNKLGKYSTVRSSTLPALEIASADTYGWLEGKAAPWIAHKLGTIPEKLQTVKVCMKEIFNNISEHSDEDTGFVHIQHYPAADKLSITISDFGKGIPAVIRTKYPYVNDTRAILLATTDGVTTKIGGGYCGHGLDELVQYTVIRNRGLVSIYSGKGGVICSPRAQRALKTPWLGTGRFPGTLVDITFRINETLFDEDEEADLEW
jgi:anti-anti-sigma regulatory factor